MNLKSNQVIDLQCYMDFDAGHPDGYKIELIQRN
jgi:hypothetical protein